MEETTTKKCSKCKKEKPLLHFGKDRNKPDGLYPSCRKCRKKPTKKRKDYSVAKVKVREPVSRYSAVRKYDFLQYIRLVMKWATANHDISRPDLEAVLYLYGKGAFVKSDFTNFYMTISMYQTRYFSDFLKNGYAVLWRPKGKGKGSSAKYVLSSKMKTLCERMHRMCVGEEEIPTLSNYNKLASDKETRINEYYIRMMKKMNKDRAK